MCRTCRYLKASLQPGYPACCCCWGPGNKRGKLIHPDTFNRHLRRLYDENGFPREFHRHTLRHYLVSMMFHKGADKQTVAGLLGHSQPSMTLDIYTHAFDKNKKAASRALQRGLDI